MAEYAPPIIATQDLTKRYGATLALERMNLALPEGGIFGFLGPNGAGKTTMIRLLLGLLRPTSGRASIFGRDCWSQSARIKQDVGYIPGDLRLYSNLSGRGILSIFGRVRGRNLGVRAGQLAERFDLDLALRTGEMSKGTRQKLGLVLALAHEPRLVILDEPTSGLDPLMQDLLKRHLRDMAAEGHTIFFSSHSLGEVEQLCDRVAILRRGRVVADTSLDELRARARREVRICWQTDEAPLPEAWPDALQIVDRTNGEWLGRWSGPVEPLVHWIASPSTPPIDDLSISPPDLETLFQEYYRE